MSRELMLEEDVKRLENFLFENGGVEEHPLMADILEIKLLQLERERANTQQTA